MSVDSSQETISERLVALMVKEGALQFGDFTLKSGRKSPYFFNLGVIRDGMALNQLASLYAQKLKQMGWQYDLLFGPAYKGIPLVSATACFMAQQGETVRFAYNRKEAKAHGEGGVLVGDISESKAIILDDILTAGTAARQAVALIEASGGSVGGLIVALDRQETGPDGRSAVKAISEDCDFPVVGLASFSDIINYINKLGDSERLQKLEQYREEFGI